MRTADPAAQLGTLAGVVAQSVPAIVEQLTIAGSARLHRDALAMLERPLLAHALRLTGGNQLRAARLLGLNRNTLRKRCRELQLGPSRPRRSPVSAPPG